MPPARQNLSHRSLRQSGGGPTTSDHSVQIEGVSIGRDRKVAFQSNMSGRGLSRTVD